MCGKGAPLINGSSKKNPSRCPLCEPVDKTATASEPFQCRIQNLPRRLPIHDMQHGTAERKLARLKQRPMSLTCGNYHGLYERPCQAHYCIDRPTVVQNNPYTGHRGLQTHSNCQQPAEMSDVAVKPAL